MMDYFHLSKTRFLFVLFIHWRCCSLFSYTTCIIQLIWKSLLKVKIKTWWFCQTSITSYASPSLSSVTHFPNVQWEFLSSTLRCLLLYFRLIYKTDCPLPFGEAFLKIVPSVFRPSDITPPFLLLNLSSQSRSHDTSHCLPLFPESTHPSGNAICKDQTRLVQGRGLDNSEWSGECVPMTLSDYIHCTRAFLFRYLW